MRRSMICPDLTNKDIALKMLLSLTGVESHLSRIMRKLGLECRVQLAVFALKVGLVNLDDIDLTSIQQRRKMVG